MRIVILIGVMALLLASFTLGQSIKNMMDIGRMAIKQQAAVDRFIEMCENIEEKHKEEDG